MFSETVDILNTPFYKHLFFDAYVVKEEGYITDDNINNIFTEQFNKGLYEKYNVTYDFSYNELLLKIVFRVSVFNYELFFIVSALTK